MQDHTQPNPTKQPARRHRSRRGPENQREQRRLFTLWILRTFTAKSHRNLLFDKNDKSSYENEDIAYFLKLPPIGGDDSDSVSQLKSRISTQKTKIFWIMASSLQQLEAKPAQNCFSEIFQQNFSTLTSSLKLNAAERTILEFFVAASVSSALCDMLRILNSDFSKNRVGFLSRILKLSPTHIHKAMQSDSKLVTSGLIIRYHREHPGLSQTPQFFSKAIACEIFAGIINEKSIISHIVTPAPPATLTLLHSHSQALNLTPSTQVDIQTLQSLQNATPGDFTNFARQCRYQDPKTASRFLQLLIQECEIKSTASSRKIGFFS